MVQYVKHCTAKITEINFGRQVTRGRALFRRKKGSPPDPLPKTAEFDLPPRKVNQRLLKKFLQSTANAPASTGGKLPLPIR